MAISVITEESVPEQVGTTKVCATLSGDSCTGTQINVTLDTISGISELLYFFSILSTWYNFFSFSHCWL